MSATALHDLDLLLDRRQKLVRVEASTAVLASQLQALRSWQSARLAHTYADLRGDARYGPATEFFLADLYGARNFDTRDEQMAQAWKFFKRMLPAAPLRALGRAIELDVLTRELDQAMAMALPETTITGETYAHAYRAVGRREARERQIALVIGAGQDLDRAVRRKWIGALLKAAHAPAHSAGLGALQDFLERGYQAFRAMPAADEFLGIIRDRETALMDRLFAGGSP
jgi:hypothetical protein